jgi:hypothetical protein
MVKSKKLKIFHNYFYKSRIFLKNIDNLLYINTLTCILLVKIIEKPL